MSHMLTFERDGWKFNLRAAAVVRRGEDVLFHRARGKDYWTLPGGRCELGETIFATIEREMLEELGVAARAQRMLWFVENHFDYEGRKWHEWLMIALTEFPDGAAPLSAREPWWTRDGGCDWEWRWIGARERASETIYPQFLATALDQLPPHPIHIVRDA